MDEGDDGKVGYPYCPESGGNGPGGDDGGAGTEPVEPGGGGGGNQGTPKAPTITQCGLAKEDCKDNVRGDVENCKVRALDYARNRVFDGSPCFGISAESIWDTRTVGPIFKCSNVSLFEESEFGRLCTNEFRRRAMLMCYHGNSERTESRETETGLTAGIEAKSGFQGSWSEKTTVKVSHTIEAKEGILNGCWTASEKAFKQCEAAEDECLEKAERAAGASQHDTQSMQFVFADAAAPVLADTAVEDQLISRIDHVLLGLEKGSSGSGLSGLKDRFKGKAPGSRTSVFHPVKRRKQESSYRYTQRLEFLVNWGDFVKRHSLPKAAQVSMESGFTSAQTAFVNEAKYEGDLVSMRFVTDATTGADGLGDSAEIFREYQRRGGNAAAIAQAEREFRNTAGGILTDQQLDDFLVRVWKGVPHLGLSAPMNLTRQVSQPTTSVAQCSESSKSVCKSAGASCEVTRGTDGAQADLCRWSSAKTEAACSKTKGLWTDTSSRYAQNHPDAVPQGLKGACISEAANLLRSR